jgi:hypothetical protein
MKFLYSKTKKILLFTKLKDRSKFISSLIVSLIAGFIYYQFGDAPVLQSFKALLSDNYKNEITISSQPFASVIRNDNEMPKYKSDKFYIQKKNIKPIEISSDDITGNQIIEFISNQTAISKKARADIQGYLASLINSEFESRSEREILTNLVSHPLPDLEKSIIHLRKIDGLEVSSLNDIPEFNFEYIKDPVKNDDKKNSSYSYSYNYDYDYNYNYNYNYNYTYDNNNRDHNKTIKAEVKNKKEKIKNKNKKSETLKLDIEVNIPEVVVNMKMKKMTIQVPDAKNNLTDIVIEIPEPQIEIK